MIKRQRVSETKYVFRVNGKPRPPKVHGQSFKLGDIVSTSDGPHKVIEVYWSGSDSRGWKATVLLSPIEESPPARREHQKPKRNQGRNQGRNQNRRRRK